MLCKVPCRRVVFNAVNCALVAEQADPSDGERDAGKGRVPGALITAVLKRH